MQVLAIIFLVIIVIWVLGFGPLVTHLLEKLTRPTTEMLTIEYESGWPEEHGDHYCPYCGKGVSLTSGEHLTGGEWSADCPSCGRPMWLHCKDQPSTTASVYFGGDAQRLTICAHRAFRRKYSIQSNKKVLVLLRPRERTNKEFLFKGRYTITGSDVHWKVNEKIPEGEAAIELFDYGDNVPGFVATKDRKPSTRHIATITLRRNKQSGEFSGSLQSVNDK